MTDTLLDELNRRDVELQQFATYLVGQYGIKSLDEAYRVARLILLDAGDISSITKANRVAAEIGREVRPIIDSAMIELTKELGAMGIAEAAFAAGLTSEFIDVNLKAPGKKSTVDFIEKAIMSLESGSSSVAGTWSSFTKNYTDNTSNLIKNQVLVGYSSSDTNAQIIKRVKSATTGVLSNKADVLIRTGTAHYAAQANAAMAKENEDVIAWVYPVVTFDSRTSVVCMSISENYGDGWAYGKSPIGLPPYHYGCRTRLQYVTNKDDLQGTRPAIAGKKGDEAEEAFERKEKLADARLENGGSGVVKYTGRKDKAFEPVQINVKTPFSKFLRDQPAWYQDKLLGKTKADAFRAGKLDLSKLTDKQLKPKTLEELGL